MKKTLLGCALAALTFAGANDAAALPLNVDVPTNAYITIGDLDWAWAGPCAPSNGCGNIDLSYQGQFGWRLPTLDEFTSSGITASSFITPGGNVDGASGNGLDEASGAWAYAAPSGVDLAIAVPYFNTTWEHADYVDGVSGLWAVIMSPQTWDYWYSETLVVRDANVHPAPVPEPGTMALFGIGAAMLAFRKKLVKA
jgi:hypothetical protein